MVKNMRIVRTKTKLDKEPETIEPESSSDIETGKEGINIGISSLRVPAKIAIGIIAIATIAFIALPAIEELSDKSLLSISPDPLSFNIGDVNANETISRNFSISNPGKETLNWKVSADKPWVNIKPISGADSGTIYIDINTAGLEPGSYAGIISIVSNEGKKSGTISFNIPQIPVTSQPSSPILKVSKKSLNFESASVGTDTKIDTLQISNDGSGALDWQAKADKTWIDLSKKSGTNEGSIVVTLNSAGLAPGKHIGTIIITSNGGTDTVFIEFNVPTPIVTTPAVTTPAVTTPAVTTPAVTTPAVTTPAVTTPAVTTPAVTTPAVTTPAVTIPPIPELTSITVSPATASVSVGNTQTFIPDPKDQFNNSMMVTVAWAITGPNLGTIDSSGLFTATTPGTTTIIAESNGIRGMATVTVTSTDRPFVRYTDVPARRKPIYPDIPQRRLDRVIPQRQ